MYRYLFVFLFFVGNCFSQNLNQFKYVEVPQKFPFQKENNMYNLNLYTKLLLEKYGFVAYMDDEIKPKEAAENNCSRVLRAVLEEDSNLFVRKLTVKLVDCQNKVVYQTKEGTSSTKDLKVAYVQALRLAFESFDTLNYKFEEGNLATAQKPHGSIVVQSNSINKVVIDLQFNARRIENGFKLQSAEMPEIIMKKSSIEHYFIAQIGDLPAVIYREGSNWKMDFYQNGELQKKTISIRFLN